MRFDKTGKITLDHIYNQTDPRKYFQTLRELSYGLPGFAKPYFLTFLQAYREACGTPVKQVLDVGCSYGINAALLRCDVSMDQLYDRYGHSESTLSREALLDRDRNLVQTRQHLPDTRFVGLDVSQAAVDYAVESSLLDEGICADLESCELSEDMRARIEGSNVIISTGCIGYVTEKTLSRVTKAASAQRPWIANFVLRMFPFGPIEAELSNLGYETRRVKQVFRQRRFASQTEQTQILDTLSDAKVDANGLESSGWLYAQLYVSRPIEAKKSPRLEALFEEG
jgi:SAM-dependent methyltransferase